MMDIHIPAYVAKALNTLHRAGYQAYIVGGCVRDALLGRIPDDWDITTSAHPQQVIDTFADYSVIPTGIRHGTVTVLVDSIPLEITTYRVDGTYSDGRHPDTVVFTADVKDDLARRDFTVNAMAFTEETGLIDPFGGREDLQQRVIRCVGDPTTRFGEDALRILRALRFASTLSFQVDDDTAEAAMRCTPLLSRIAAERITVEISKLLTGIDAPRVLSVFRSIIYSVVPGLPDVAEQWDDVCRSVSQLTPVLTTRLACLFAYTTAPLMHANTAFEVLRLDGRTEKRVRDLLTHVSSPIDTDANLLKLAGLLGWECARELLQLRVALAHANADVALQRLEQLAEHKPCCCLGDLAINGADLIAAGMAPSPLIGSTLEKALDAVIAGTVPNDKEALLQFILN